MSLLSAEETRRQERNCAILPRGHFSSPLGSFLSPEYDQVRVHYKAEVAQVRDDYMAANQTYTVFTTQIPSYLTVIPLEDDESLICGPLFGLTTAHMRMTSSGVRLQMLPKKLIHVLGLLTDTREAAAEDNRVIMDLLLYPIPSSITTTFVDIRATRTQDLIAVDMYQLGAVMCKEIPVLRPFLFLAAFQDDVWIIIIASILATALVTSLAKRKGRWKNWPRRFGSVAYLFAGLFLAESMSDEWKRFSRPLTGLWVLASTILSACFCGSMRELMAAAGEPAVIGNLSDLANPLFRHVSFSTVDLSPERFFMYRSPELKPILEELESEDRVILSSYTEVTDPATVMVITVAIVMGYIISTFMERVLLNMFAFLVTYLTHLKMTVDVDELATIHISLPTDAEPEFLLMSAAAPVALRRGYEVVTQRLSAAGLLEMWFYEAGRRLREVLPQRRPSAFSQLRLVEWTGAGYAVGLGLTLGLLVLVTAEMSAHQIRLKNKMWSLFNR